MNFVFPEILGKAYFVIVNVIYGQLCLLIPFILSCVAVFQPLNVLGVLSTKQFDKKKMTGSVYTGAYSLDTFILLFSSAATSAFESRCNRNCILHCSLPVLRI